MSAAPEVAKAAPSAPGATPRPPAPAGRAATSGLTRRVALLRLGKEWAALAAWTIGRTGIPGLVGIGALLAAAVFLFSTHLQVAAEVEGLRTDLATAERSARPAAPDEVAEPTTAIRALPARGDMPAILRELFGKAAQARLALDTGRYEINAARSGGGVVRYQVAFPVTGPYPQIRAFLDATLATMPAVALSDLALARKSIGEGAVEAQIRMTVFTDAADSMAPVAPAGAGPASVARRGPERWRASDRIVAPTYAAALFAPHSWYVPAPPAPEPPPPPPPPEPEPTAPPLPYGFVGSYAPQGHAPVYFLSRGDRVFDARVGDRLDGVYQFESAAGGRLVFVYLPLNVRQILAAGASK